MIRRNHKVVDPLLKPDSEIYAIIQPKVEEKRKHLMEQVFEKKYHNISAEDLADFVAKFCRRLYLFKRHFPTNLVEILKAVLSHPNLSRLQKTVSTSHAEPPLGP